MRKNLKQPEISDRQSESSNLKSSNLFWLSLALVLALAVAVRFYRLGADDYWLDELHSMGSSAAMRATFEAFPFGEIFTHRESGTKLGPESTLADVWYEMRDDTHPPLFFTLLNLWRRAVGDNEAAVRAFPATCSVISIAAVPLLFRRLGRPYVGILAACLLALAFGHIYMAQQNRQYAQALLFTALSYLALIVAEDREAAARRRGGSASSKQAAHSNQAAHKDRAAQSSPLCKGGSSGVGGAGLGANSPEGTNWKLLLAWSLYALTLCLCVLTHYFTALALAGQIIYAAVRFRSRTLWHWIAAGAGAVALSIVLWGDGFMDQRWIITKQPWLYDTSEGHAYRSLMRVGDLPLRLLFQLPPFRIELWRSIGGLLLAGIVIFGAWYAAWRGSRRDSQRCASPPLPLGEGSGVRATRAAPGCPAARRWGNDVCWAAQSSRAALLMSVWFVVPCIAFLFTDIAFDKQTLNHIRYPMVAIMGLAGLVALAITELRPLLRYVTAAALCIAMLGTLSFPTTSNPDARIAVAELQSRAAPEDLIIFDAIGWPQDWIPQFFAPMEFYMDESTSEPPTSVGADVHGQSRRSIANDSLGEFHVNEGDGGKSRGWPNPMLLLRDPPSNALAEQISAFDRYWVVSPRVDQNHRPIIPNHSPATHTLKANSGYIWQIGWIYLFERKPATAAP